MHPASQTFDLAWQYHQAGHLQQAESLYRQVLQIDPRHVDALHMFGLIAHQFGRNEEAVDCIQQAIRLRPKFPVAYNNLGMALIAQGKPAAALASYQRALLQKPDFTEAHFNLGIALQDQGKLEEAVASYRHAVRLKPNFAEAHNNLGDALTAQGKLEEAIASCRQALRLKPDLAGAHINLGCALRDQGKFEEAITSYQRALRLRPDYAEAYNNLANILTEQGKLAEGRTHYQRALRLKPDYAEAHHNLAALLLLMGDFSEGWQEFEWRWQTRQFRGTRHFAQPLWQGNPLHHGTILLHAEQGLGDTIQFIRFAALVKQRVGTVFFACPPALARLLRSCAGIDRIIPFGEPLPAYDVQAPLMSLPRILKTTLSTIPASIPYLHTDSVLKEVQVRELTSSTDFKIGLVWQGNPRTWDTDHRRADRRRSIPLAQFEPLARIPGVRLISLQKNFGTEQIQKLASRFPIVDLGSSCDDFCDTAAVMKMLDLVISVDTSPAHLAGALGVPVWVALPSVCCWRWLTQREDSPWYPTMRLFRQSAPGDWSDVVEHMARELLALHLGQNR